MSFLSHPEARAALVLLVATLSAGCPPSVTPGDDVGPLCQKSCRLLNARG